MVSSVKDKSYPTNETYNIHNCVFVYDNLVLTMKKKIQFLHNNTTTWSITSMISEIMIPLANHMS